MGKQQSTTIDNNDKKNKKTVSFDTVVVREYPVVLSDNPGGGSRYGPSVELGWEYRLASEVQSLQSTKAHRLCHGWLSVDEYETIRPSQRRRTLKSLFLFGNQREYRLKKNYPYTDDDIQQAIAEKARIVQHRERSLLLQSLRIRKNWSTVNRSRKIRRGVHNLKKKHLRSCCHHEIYNGWWLPLSAYLF